MCPKKIIQLKRKVVAVTATTHFLSLPRFYG
jgi:hypothetical protein